MADSDFARKASVSLCLSATPLPVSQGGGYAHSGVRFTRVWLEGVASPCAADDSLLLSDASSASILLKSQKTCLQDLAAAQRSRSGGEGGPHALQPLVGVPLMVVGKLVTAAGTRQVRVQVANLLGGTPREARRELSLFPARCTLLLTRS